MAQGYEVEMIDHPSYKGPERRQTIRRYFDRDRQAELNLQNSRAIHPSKLS